MSYFNLAWVILNNHHVGKHHQFEGSILVTQKLPQHLKWCSKAKGDNNILYYYAGEEVLLEF